MDREETHALFAQGKDAWNAWATDMLAKKKALQDAGKWDMGKDANGNPKPRTPETKSWQAAASVVFSSKDTPHTFETDVDFTGWIFPGNASFHSAVFSRHAVFNGVKFDRDVEFQDTNFGEVAWFDDARFVGDAGFERAVFRHVARFSNVNFVRNAGFMDSKFRNYTTFKSTTIGERASFNLVTFSGATDFRDTTFVGRAGFAGATFEKNTSFIMAKFEKQANFTAILAMRAFSLADARFLKVPDFIQAKFSEAPRLDNVDIRPGWVEGDTLWQRVIHYPKSCWKRFRSGDRNLPARWRALKRLAIQGHDLEREQLFFPKEIRTARFNSDWPLPFTRMIWSPPNDKPDAKRPLYARIPIVPWRKSAWAGFFRFWSGVLYQIFSDFGRSLLRPGLTFLAIALVSAAMYLGESQRLAGTDPSPLTGRIVAAATHTFADSQTLRAAHPCAPVSGQNLRSLEPEIAARTDALSEAMHLSWTNGSIVGGLGGLNSARRTYGCLYGFVQDGGQNLTPIMPAAVSIIATWQKLFSVILIFLFGLAIRNMLKMH